MRISEREEKDLRLQLKELYLKARQDHGDNLVEVGEQGISSALEDHRHGHESNVASLPVVRHGDKLGHVLENDRSDDITLQDIIKAKVHKSHKKMSAMRTSRATAKRSRAS